MKGMIRVILRNEVIEQFEQVIKVAFGFCRVTRV